MTLKLYQQTKDPELGKKLLAEHKDTINKYVSRWSGVLPEVVLRQHANKYAMDAFESYDETKGADIKTHMHSHLQRLARLNYENQNTMKIPEHQIRQISNYNDAVSHLKDKLNRDPEIHEIADHLALPPVHVERIAKNLRKEYVSDGELTSVPSATVGANDAQKLYVKDLTQRLPSQHKQVMQMIGSGAKPADIGAKLNMKPYQVSRLKEQIAKHFKQGK